MGFRTYTCKIARNCGGCEWLSVPYPIQLRRKQEEVESLLGDMAASCGARIDKICGVAGEPLAYRHKAATPFAPAGHGRIRCGFYAAGTHRIIPCEKCLVEDPRARKILNGVARVAERLHIPAYEEDRGIGVLRHAVVRCGYATDDVLLTLVTNVPELRGPDRVVAALREECPEVTSIVQNVNTRRTNAILGKQNRTLWGTGVMHDKLLGCTFEIGPSSFYQTNPEQTEVLYQLALEAAGFESGMSVLDAYCGTGTIGICAAAANSGVEVTGVERVASAVRCAERNARANGVAERCDFVAADATEWMSRKAGERHFDVVLMDPPRAGSTPEFLHGVADLAPERVVYVSCNVQTQARDLEILLSRGYRLQSVAPVDMFPHTKHVETVAVLSRKSASKSFIPVSISPKDMGLSEEKEQPTYANIRDYVQKTHGMKVSTLYVAQMKAECGLETQADRSGDKKQPKCPPEKREAILDAFRHFGLIGEDGTEE